MKTHVVLWMLTVIFVLPTTVLAQGPPHAWSYSYGDSNYDAPQGLALDGAGNIIMTGFCGPDTDFGGDPMVKSMFLAKFDADANHIWSHSYGDPSRPWAGGIAVDSGDNIIITGSFEDELDFGGGALLSDTVSIFLAKFDADGGHIWSFNYEGLFFWAEAAKAICVDGANNIFITGMFSDSLNFGGPTLSTPWDDNVYLAKFDADGNHLWSQSFGGMNREYGSALATDAAGNVILTGGFYDQVGFGGSTLTSTGGLDVFLAKFNAGGTHLWSKGFGDTQDDYAGDVHADGAGNVLITGAYRGTVDFGGGSHTSAGAWDIYLAKFNSSGTHLWSHSFGDYQWDTGRGLATDEAGNIVLGGSITGSVGFGGDPLLTGPGYSDAFIAKLDPDGGHIWSQAFGDTSNQWVQFLAIDAEGNTIITGGFEGSVDFGGGMLSVTGNVPIDEDIFLAKFGAPPEGWCHGSYLSLNPAGVIPTTTSTSFEERGAYITALKNFEVCALGMNIQLALPQEVIARIYEADGTTRGALVAEEAWTTFLPGEVVHFVPINYVLEACRDYEIAFEFEVAPTWSWYDERTFTEPFDVGGAIRVRDGDYAGNASNFILPHLAVMGSVIECERYSNLTPPEAVWSTCGSDVVELGIHVTPNQTMTVCRLAWEADFPEVPAPITAKIYEMVGAARGDLIALGFGQATSPGMTLHEVPINAVLREGSRYDLVVETPPANFRCVFESAIALPYTIDDAIIVEDGEQWGNPLDSVITHFDVSWSPGTGNASFNLGKSGGPYPPPNTVMGGWVRQGIYITSLVDQNLYSLGWNADVPPGAEIHARVYEAGATTRGALISEGSVVSAASGMRWHDIPVTVACTSGIDYDFEIEAPGTDEWRWWNDETGLPYNVQNVIQVRDAEHGGDPLNVGLVELRMNACDAVLTAVMDPARSPSFHIGVPYPNPTAATSTIEFGLDRAGPVTITVYDVAGRRVKTLLSNMYRSAGPGRLEFDASALASGVYFVQIETLRKSVSRKITIVR